PGFPAGCQHPASAGPCAQPCCGHACTGSSAAGPTGFRPRDQARAAGFPAAAACTGATLCSGEADIVACDAEPCCDHTRGAGSSTPGFATATRTTFQPRDQTCAAGSCAGSATATIIGHSSFQHGADSTDRTFYRKVAGDSGWPGAFQFCRSCG
ncbi:MAG TPA: hypothetical protein VK785_08750, partial [Opitutaceae bacterium]|nr:hypothetical protein [Opitutaceae bacterium]